MTVALGLEASYNALRDSACAQRTERDAVLVRGPDARSWLQGQLSQDIAGLEVGDSAETLVLSPQGKVESYCRVSVLAEEAVLLDTESGTGEVLLERLRRFRLRVKAELETGTVQCLTVRGPASSQGLAAAGVEPGRVVPGGRAERLGDPWALAVVVEWPGYSGFDLLASGDEALPALDVPLGDPAAFEAARIEAGVPALGRELTDKTIPQEAGALVEHTVSFTKGCFTGQELVARLDARGGNVAWRLRGVVLAPEAQDRSGTPLVDGDREVGRLTSVSWSPRFAAPVGLCYVRRDVVPPFVAATASELARAEIRELPL